MKEVKFEKGLDEEKVRKISELKNEPEWMLEYRLKSYKDFINKQLSSSSIYVMASHEESFGLVLIEAQSFALPCIAFDSAKGACEIIDDKVNGYLIKDRSKKDMANAILELIDNLELRRSMGEKGRDNACKYSKENISAMWFDFLESLLNK